MNRHEPAKLKGSGIKMRPHSVRGQMILQSMLLPSRELVADTLKTLPSDKRTELGALRSALAAEAGTEACCPVTTQRELLAIAETEVARHGGGTPGRELVPFWRVIDPGRPLARRVAGGAAFIAARQAEDSQAD